MNDSTIKFRADQLQAMHEVIRCANDENIYMAWIPLVPDEPSREDFESIAENTEAYNEVIDLFIYLVSKKGYRA
ncbi:MAG: hypothetical protein AB7D36_05460 [Oscillospiraceae bacterium]